MEIRRGGVVCGLAILEEGSLDHTLWMKMALSLAESSLNTSRVPEVPVGAVMIYKENWSQTKTPWQLLTTGINLKESHQDPTAHAELSALQKASQLLGSWRLNRCILYTTLEPCVMCVGAMIQARLPLVVYGLASPKFGALGSLYDFSQDPRINHKFTYIAGIQELQIKTLMQAFFSRHRKASGIA